MTLMYKRERKNDMTLVARRVKCLNCGKKFFWNPDVGKGNCPRCGKRWSMSMIEKMIEKKTL